METEIDYFVCLNTEAGPNVEEGGGNGPVLLLANISKERHFLNVRIYFTYIL